MRQAGSPPQFPSNSGTSTGFAEVFTGAGNSWSSPGPLTPTTTLNASDRFGWTVAIYQLNSTPETVLVGAPLRDFTSPTVTDAGAAFVFNWSGSAWAEQTMLQDAAPAGGDQFGYAVALSEGTALIGVPFSTVGGASRAGEAYLFTHGTGNNWTQQQQLLITDVSGHTADTGDSFGSAVALAGNAPVVGAQGEAGGQPANHGSASFYTFPCAFGYGYTSPQWNMVALPCNPSLSSIGFTFGNNFNGVYNSRWVMQYLRFPLSNQYLRLTSTADELSLGVGYWLKSLDAPYGHNYAGTQVLDGPLDILAGSATTLVTGNANCASANGCYVIPLTVPTVAATSLYNLVALPLSFNVDWGDVRVEVVGASGSPFTPSLAAPYMDKTFWVYNGTNAYYDFDDATPGKIGTLRTWRGFWVKVLPGAIGKTVNLYIPAKPSMKTSLLTPDSQTGKALAVAALPWYLGWLDWVVPTAAAATDDMDNHEMHHDDSGARIRDQKIKANERAIAAKKAWFVRLIATMPDNGFEDRNCVFGQLPDSVFGYDDHDLRNLAPPFSPYMRVVFPHPEWGNRAGDYSSDFRSIRDNRKGHNEWTFEIRTDVSLIGHKVMLRWEGDPEILKKSILVDATGRRIEVSDPSYQNELEVFMADKVQRLTWKYKIDKDHGD